MATCNPCYEDELNEHDLVACDIPTKGGGDAIIVLPCDHEVTDPSDEVQVEAALAAGARLVQNVKVGIPEATAQTQETIRACATSYPSVYDGTITLEDGNITDNNVNSFYPELFSGRPFGGAIIYECATGKVKFIDKEIRFTGSIVLPNTSTEIQMAIGTGSYRYVPGEIVPKQADAPAGIFS